MMFANPKVAHPQEVHLNPTTPEISTEQLVTSMSERMATLTRTLSAFTLEQPHTLAELEQHTLRLLKEVANSLLAGLCGLAASTQPSASISCECGQQARYLRERKAQVTTLLGPICFNRPYYHCAACGHGQHPLDADLQICAGSRSPALDEMLALLGATQDSFAQAAQVLERLSLVHVSPNSVRQATEQLGALLVAQPSQPLSETVPSSLHLAPSRLYITMDGVLAHLHERGWSEIKVGCCYQTRSRPSSKQPEQVEIRAHSPSYVASLAQAQSFGWQLWEEVVRRGGMQADELVVLADGAHWIWNIAESHFAQATQIVDWYHASHYLWEAGNAIWPQPCEQRQEWVRSQVQALWEGRVEQVLVELQQQPGRAEAVEAAISYYSTHKRRMDYPSYRARGLHIGSGSVESACKQIVSARLKQAGMIWGSSGAEAVAALRAWLKSERWEEAIKLRPARTRSYRRQGRTEAVGEQAVPVGQEIVVARGESRSSTEGKGSGGLNEEVLKTVREALAQQRANSPWRKAWSVRRQRQQLVERSADTNPALAA